MPFSQAVLTIVEMESLNMWQQAAFFASHNMSSLPRTALA
jgi:hypothetical protein